ncbi:TolC family protein [Herbaspirillum sp. alder98]|uniref:TolC family protein n=1 Tax=Herbaspirillum sp. alder98 TaxID=2913096 RepID=UPI001CD85865|nr:TolC family protein [Herbaspirillum sp. alder98]MCA1323949.1 TolC family protein [Herbaspirillum sp. alder98]
MFKHVLMPALTAALLLPAGHVMAQNPPDLPLATGSGCPAVNAALTLPQAQQLALDHNPGLASARHALAATDGALQQAGAWPNPQLAVEIEDTRRATRTTTYTVSQTLELGGKRRARTDAAQLAQDMARQQLAARLSGLRSEVTLAWLEVLHNVQRLALARHSATLAERMADSTGRRVQAGKLPPLEQTRAQVAAAGIALEVSQADSEWRISQYRLNALLGRGACAGQPEGDGDVLPPLPEIGDVVRRAASAPVVRLAALEVDRRQALSAIESSKRTPDVTLSLGSKRDEEAARNALVIGVSMPLPLFDRNQGNLLQALRQADQARDDLVAAELQAQMAAAEGFETLRHARAEALSLRQQVLPAAQQAYDTATRGFTLGKFGLTEVLDAQRTLFDTQTRYLRALTGAHRADAALQALLGDDPTSAPGASH